MRYFLITFAYLSVLMGNAAPSILVDGQQLLAAIAYDEQDAHQNIYEWEVTSSTPALVSWDPEGSKWTGEGFTRSGKILLSNKGKITHHVVGEEVKSGDWSIQLFAKKSIINKVILAPNAITQENPHVNVDVIHIDQKVVCRDETVLRQTGYRIKFPGKHPFWMDEVRKSSPKGSASTYIITFEEKPPCVIQKLKDEAEVRRLEKQKLQEEAVLEKKRKELEVLREKKAALEKIRQANEELKRQEITEINRVKKELEELLDQKVNLGNMLGAQESFNYQQSLQLIQSKISFIKYQKKMAKKIEGVKSNIDLLGKELQNAQDSLKKLNKQKTNADKAKYLRETAKIKKRLLDQSKRLLESYEEEKQINETSEKIGKRLVKDGSISNSYVIKQGEKTTSTLALQEEKHKRLREKVLKKIIEAQAEVLRAGHEVQQFGAQLTKIKDNDKNSTKANLAEKTLAAKKKILEQSKNLLQSYENKKKEYDKVLEQITKTKQQFKRVEKKSKQDVFAHSSSNQEKPIQPEKRQSLSLDGFLREYLASGTREITRSSVRRYFAPNVRPYYKIANASREDIYRDKVKYVRRWPERDYKLNNYHVVDRYEMGGRKYIEILMTLDWRVYSDSRGQKTGDSTVSLTLDITGGQYLITALRSAKIRHNIPDRSSRRTLGRSDEKTVTINDNGVRIEIEYPRIVQAGEMFTLTARMTNRVGRIAKQGGLTLSFPDMMRLSGSIKRGNFNSVQGYSYPDQIFSNVTHRKMTAEYFMVEGWHKHKWRRGSTKYFTVSLRAPQNMAQLHVNARGILWIRNKHDTRPAPGRSLTRDQQGFAVRQFTINIQ